MTEKYIDLAPLIANMHDQPLGTMRVVLGLLDEFASEHPDQVPGRTITLTESQVEVIGRDAINYFKPGGTWADWARAVFMSADFPVIVPDPEPTNAEKLEKIVWDSDGPIGSISLDRASRLAAWLDEHGVKAPGGDDEH